MSAVSVKGGLPPEVGAFMFRALEYKLFRDEQTRKHYGENLPWNFWLIPMFTFTRRRTQPG